MRSRWGSLPPWGDVHSIAIPLVSHAEGQHVRTDLKLSALQLQSKEHCSWRKALGPIPWTLGDHTHPRAAGLAVWFGPSGLSAEGCYDRPRKPGFCCYYAVDLLGFFRIFLKVRIHTEKGTEQKTCRQWSKHPCNQHPEKENIANSLEAPGTPTSPKITSFKWNLQFVLLCQATFTQSYACETYSCYCM